MKTLDVIRKVERGLCISLLIFQVVVYALVAIAATMFVLSDYFDSLFWLFVIATLIIVVVGACTIYVEHLKKKEAEEEITRLSQ